MRSKTFSIGVRYRRRATTAGETVHKRYVLDFSDPATGQRRQLFFPHKKDAENRRRELLENLKRRQVRDVRDVRQALPAPPRAAIEARVADVIEGWLNDLSPSLKPSTLHYYRQMARYTTEPVVLGSATQRRRWSRQGSVPRGVPVAPALGDCPLSALTTQAVRSWHTLLVENVGQHTANAAKSVLGSAIRRWSEENDWSPPPLPRTVARAKGSRKRKSVLTPAQIALLMDTAWNDTERGIYYSFPFLTGVRPSEQLGLLWRDIDLENGIIRISRMQELDGSLCDLTKTEASTRDIPIGALLHKFLVRWQKASPTGGQPDARVFVTLGTPRSRRHTQIGKPLTYWNFMNSYWRPVMRRLGLPQVAPHSARHSFISLLQAHGAEVGVVAKLAGHANPNITLGYYTRAVRDGRHAISQMERAMLSGTHGIEIDPGT